jgi:hypothetical protein
LDLTLADARASQGERYVENDDEITGDN